MKKDKIVAVLLLSGLALVAFLAIAPDALIMPSSLQMLIIGLVVVLLSFYLGFIWREQPKDERENEILSGASRAGYIAGSVVLLVALAIQSFQHHLDSAVPIALVVMVAIKMMYHFTKE